MFCQMQWCQLCSEDFKFFCQEESFVFTLGAGAAPVIVTKADLSKSLEQLQQLPVKLHLRKVSEVAMSLVAALEVGRWDQCSVKESYGNLSKPDLQVAWLIFYFNSLSPWTLLLQPFWFNGQTLCSQAATESARESAYLQLLNAVPCRSRIVSKKQNLKREIGYDRLPKWLVRKHHFCDTNFLRRRMSTCAALIDSDNYHFVHKMFHGWFIPWSGLVKKIPHVWAWDNSLIRLLSQDICPVSSINY